MSIFNKRKQFEDLLYNFKMLKDLFYTFYVESCNIKLKTVAFCL